MYLVELDEPRSLLRITFRQRVGRDEATACCDEVLGLVGRIKPGFRMLTDLSQLAQMDLACEPFIDRVMDACDQAGVSKIVRVVPDPSQDIGFGIMSLFHYGRNVHIVTCQSLEEAEALLT